MRSFRTLDDRVSNLSGLIQILNRHRAALAGTLQHQISHSHQTLTYSLLDRYILNLGDIDSPSLAGKKPGLNRQMIVVETQRDHASLQMHIQRGNHCEERNKQQPAWLVGSILVNRPHPCQRNHERHEIGGPNGFHAWANCAVFHSGVAGASLPDGLRKAQWNRPMSPEPITVASRELLGTLRNLLLEQHKLLLDRERLAYEKLNQPISGPGALLNLLINDPHFAWLKRISSLVVEIDEALSRNSKAGQPDADLLIAQARDLMKPRAEGSDFQTRYYDAIQESPDIVILQCRIVKLLGV